MYQTTECEDLQSVGSVYNLMGFSSENYFQDVGLVLQYLSVKLLEEDYCYTFEQLNAIEEFITPQLHMQSQLLLITCPRKLKITVDPEFKIATNKAEALEIIRKHIDENYEDDIEEQPEDEVLLAELQEPLIKSVSDASILGIIEPAFECQDYSLKDLIKVNYDEKYGHHYNVNNQEQQHVEEFEQHQQFVNDFNGKIINPYGLDNHTVSGIYLMNVAPTIVIYAPPCSGKTTFNYIFQDYDVKDTDYKYTWDSLKMDCLLTNDSRFLSKGIHSLAVLPQHFEFNSRCIKRGLKPDIQWYLDVLNDVKNLKVIYTNGYLLNDAVIEYFFDHMPKKHSDILEEF